jgi:magnesium-protoporphyrin O-methyltransferase
MSTLAYRDRVSRLETYFDRTALQAWAAMTSDAPLGRIRATVRAGRDAMRSEILAQLPNDMSGMRLLDAGCGTGALAIEAARRGAEVVGVDISPKLIGIARDRTAHDPSARRVRFETGDLLDPALGRFDSVVAMDVLIHYPIDQALSALATLGERTQRSIHFTFAPRTTLLALMHTSGKLFPRSDRSPAIEPVHETRMRRALASHPVLRSFDQARSIRISTGFYISQLVELSRP